MEDPTKTRNEEMHEDIGYTVGSIFGPDAQKRLNVIHGTGHAGASTGRAPVLYVHGGTFPATLAVGWRFDGRSWMDDLGDAGFDVWGFDFLGFGGSDRYDEMALPASAHPPLGRAPFATRQLECAVRHVLGAARASRVTLLAHSWGSLPAARFAVGHPDLMVRAAGGRTELGQPGVGPTQCFDYKRLGPAWRAVPGLSGPISLTELAM